MKKVLFALLAVAFIVTSCSKESKLNKSLDGTWNVTTIDGAAMPTGTSMSIVFAKDKKGKGTYDMTLAMTGFPSETDKGTYELEGDEKMYTTSTTTANEKDTLLIVSYSKTDLKVTDTAGKEAMELKKQ